MKKIISFVVASMLLAAGAVAETDRSQPAAEQSAPGRENASSEHRNNEGAKSSERKGQEADEGEGLGAMGAGATGTTGGMGATTGTDTIEE